MGLLFKKIDVFITFDRKSVIFGKFLNSYLYKTPNLIMLVKQYIFANKNHNNISYLNFNVVKKIIKDGILLETKLLKNCRYLDYESHWQTICEKCNMFVCLLYLPEIAFTFLFLNIFVDFSLTNDIYNHHCLF